MKKQILFLAAATLVSFGAAAHSGKNPAHELEKNGQRLADIQASFTNADEPSEQLDNLERQLYFLQRNVLLARGLIAKEYPLVKESMTKYKLDYLEVLEEELKRLKVSLKQAKKLINRLPSN